MRLIKEALIDPPEVDMIEFSEQVELDGIDYWVYGTYSNHQDEFVEWTIDEIGFGPHQEHDQEDKILSLVYEQL